LASKHENDAAAAAAAAAAAVASSSKESSRSRRNSTSALELKRRQESNRNPQKPPLSPPVVTEEESNSTNTSISAVNSISGSERGGEPRRRSSVSKVPSLPSLPDMSKLTIHGREDLTVSDLSALDLVPSSKTSKTNVMDGSVSSLTSAFSGFDSVYTARESQGKQIILNGNSSRSINSSSTPEADTNKKNNKAAQAEAAKYVLQMDKKAESSQQHQQQQQLVFEIPTTFEVKGHKEHHKQSTGLVLSLGKNNEKDAVMVKEISPTSLFVGTSLKSGQEVLMINSLRVKCPKQAAKIMKSLSGDLAIYVSEGTRAPGMKYIRVRVGHEKKKGSYVRLKPDEDMERLLQATNDIILETQSDGLVRVARVDPSGMFRKDLRAGDIVLTVNGTLIQDEEGWKKLILETASHGVICVLIYSMADLVKGLVNQLLPSWESAWKSDTEVSISRARQLEGEAKNDVVSFSLLWGADWVCECNQSDEEAVYKSEILPSLEKINWATSLVIKSFVEVSGVQYKQSTFFDVSNATDRTAEATDDESSFSDQKARESQQLTDPTIEAVTDDDDSDELGQRRAPRRGAFNETSARLGKSFMHEIHADDDSSFEEC
jgi:type II secretory pathway component PulC